ncbi:MAG: LysR family transcriptional regulator [Kiritimatiellia bacterium]
MELRHLRYFLAIAEAGSFSLAAERLHVSQPALSQQIAQFEEELGGLLFIRTSRRLQLTEKALLLSRRAQEILELTRKTKDEMTVKSTNELTGTLVIGAGETVGFGLLARAMKYLRERHPTLSFDVISGNANDLCLRMHSGTIDLCLLIGSMPFEGLEFLVFPQKHRWGIILRSDDPLANRKAIRVKDLFGKPLIVPRQKSAHLESWIGESVSNLTIAGTYNLLYNAMFMVRASLGFAVCIDNLFQGEFQNELVFRPFMPALQTNVYLSWRKGVETSPATRALIDAIRMLMQEPS